MGVGPRLASGRTGWAALCRLVSGTHLSGERGSPVLDLLHPCQDLVFDKHPRTVLARGAAGLAHWEQIGRLLRHQGDPARCFLSGHVTRIPSRDLDRPSRTRKHSPWPRAPSATPCTTSGFLWAM